MRGGEVRLTHWAHNPEIAVFESRPRIFYFKTRKLRGCSSILRIIDGFQSSGANPGMF